MDAEKLLGKALDPSFWKGVREKDCYIQYRKDLFHFWEAYAAENRPIVAVRYSLFRLFFETGDRTEYEKANSARLFAISAAALLSLIYPEEPKYFDRLCDEIFAMCDEYTWCLPAHQKQNVYANSVNIDLISSTTGLMLAEMAVIFGNRLPPLIRSRIHAELERRIFTPFLTFEPYAFWECGKMNWTAVCMGTVACAFMLLRPEQASQLIPRFNRSMDTYLEGFSEEGFCEEGCGYWNYGFGFFTLYADMVRNFTDGEVDYFKRDKVRKIATFCQKMFLSGGAGVSFSDVGEVNYHLGILHYLKKEYPKDVCLPDPAYSYTYGDCAYFSIYWRAVAWLDEEKYTHPAKDLEDMDFYAPSLQWLLKRNEKYGFAAKGGSNGEAHNHNDVGSFIFAKNGNRDLTDPGRGLYTRQYFSEKRYEIAECSSRGHSLPIIAGQYQKEGKECRAVGAKYENGVFSMDIAPAYGIPELASLLRSFTCDEEGFTLTDRYTYSGKGPIVERIVSFTEPKQLSGNRLAVGSTVLTFPADTCDYACHTEELAGGTLYQMDFTLRPGVRAFTLRAE